MHSMAIDRDRQCLRRFRSYDRNALLFCRIIEDGFVGLKMGNSFEAVQSAMAEDRWRIRLAASRATTFPNMGWPGPTRIKLGVLIPEYSYAYIHSFVFWAAIFRLTLPPIGYSMLSLRLALRFGSVKGPISFTQGPRSSCILWATRRII